MNRHKKVIIGMSGGVDSSVSAYILQKQGFHVEAVFMKNWEEDDNDSYCASKIDLIDAQNVCNKLNIKLHTINFSAEYWNNVFEYFLQEYRDGRTPNPDVLCNKEIKFKTFLEFAIEDLEADYIATGHYVRCVYAKDKSLLLRSMDNEKDQSYFLYTLSYEHINRSLFPISELKKSKVRMIAEDLNFENAKKKDSTGICFIGKRKFREFIGRYLPEKPGKIITIDGYELGQHKGLMYYTIGQRKGLCIGGIKNGNKKPWYVVDKKVKENILIVAQGRDHPSLMSIGLIANQIYWVNRRPLIGVLHCTVKTRYHQKDVPCSVTMIDNDHAEVIFEKPIFAVTPGQSTVFYKDEVCLGGGTIKNSMLLIDTLI